MRSRVRTVGQALGRFDQVWEMILASVVALAASVKLLNAGIDPDYWWHVATGWWMLDNHRPPMVDPFSAGYGARPWYAHEWLADLALGLADRSVGYTGGVLVTVALVAIGAWLLWRSAVSYGAPTWAALVIVAGAGVFGFAVRGFLAVRPQVWAWTLLALLLHELAAYDVGRRQRLWHVPLIFALWINTHLSALIGGLILALFAVHVGLQSLAQRRRASSTDGRFAHVMFVGVLSLAALSLNPRGPALLWFMRVYVEDHHWFAHYIAEWRRPAITAEPVRFIVGGVWIAATAWAMAQRRSLFPGVLVPVFGLAAALVTRYLPVFVLVSTPVGGWLVGGAVATHRPPSLAPLRQAAGFLLACLAVVTPATALRTYPRGGSDPPVSAATSGYPVGAAAWVRTNLPGSAVFNDYSNGGYLIYAFYPDRRVYIDGRGEMYGGAFLDRAQRIANGAPGLEDIVAEAGVGAVIISPQSVLAFNLGNDQRWRKAFADSTGAVYVPVERPNP